MAKVKGNKKIFMNKNKDSNQKKNKDTPVKQKGIQKPVSKAKKEENLKARVALGSGEVDKAEQSRRKDQDSRSLYIRFTGTNLPTHHDEIKSLHSDIKFVRTPRTAGKKNKENTEAYNYAFLEFSNEEECTKAKNKLATTRFGGKELYVDFVGEKSKSAASKKSADNVKNNPSRLFVCGLSPGVTKKALAEMFPKCNNAEIPANSVKKGTPFGFVQFSNPGDAKAAFDAAQNLDIDGHKITVLYAKVTEDKEEVIKKKQLKRKKQEEKKKEKKLKKAKLEEAKADVESSDDDEVEFKTNPKGKKVEAKEEEEENDQDSEDDDTAEVADDDDNEEEDDEDENKVESEDEVDDDDDDDDESEDANQVENEEEDEDEDDDDEE